jgi:hypothetical protein
MKKIYVLLALTIFVSLSATSCAKPKARTIDVDLTMLSSTMVYAEVFNIMMNPDDYIGKTIKASGPYVTSLYQDEAYHFVLVEGADPCCPEGLMFVWNGNHTYPDDYPEEGTEIEIIGIFKSYDGFDFEYYYFDVDDLVVSE